MYPNLLSIFNIHLYGIRFEQITMAFFALLMLWGILNSIKIYKTNKKTEATIQFLITTAAFIWLTIRIIHTITSPETYILFFKEEIVLHTYAFLILVGIALGIIYALREAKKQNIPPSSIFNLILLLLLFGFIAARIVYIIVEINYFKLACTNPQEIGLLEKDCLKAFRFSEGGLTFYGGFIGGLMTFFIYAKITKQNPLQITDILTPALALAHAFGRLGCLAAGCCWGEITSSPIAIKYDHNSFAYNEWLNNPDKHPELIDLQHQTHTPPTHPVQIYEATGELLIFALLIYWGTRKKTKTGELLPIWMISYGIWRFLTELLRGDASRGYLFKLKSQTINNLLALPQWHNTILSTSQFIGLIMLLLGTIAFIIIRKTSKTPA